MKYVLIATIILVLVVTVLGGPIAFGLYYTYGTDTEVTFTVKEKERIVTKYSSRYLVFTEDEVFENTDSLLWWKWNSSDVYNDLDEGQTYQAHVYGWRVPFLSWYRNIIEVEEKIAEA